MKLKLKIISYQLCISFLTVGLKITQNKGAATPAYFTVVIGTLPPS
jgi:hypothetical protein